MLVRVERLFRDALYLTVGAGVLAFQKAQVQRRELQDRLNRATGRTAG
jgi:hypothetical protein